MKKLLILFCCLFPLGVQAQNITTYAGTGAPMPLGNGGDASSGGIAYPLGISLDFSGNLLVCQDLLIRKINLTTQHSFPVMMLVYFSE